MLVVGVMIGSGIFIVSSEMAREIGSPGWLLVAWAIAGALTIAGALSYGELSAMMPHAGGMYVYLREAYSPLWGFLYGWTLFTVIQTGTIAAVAVAFARFTGVLSPAISEDRYLVSPLRITSHYAISLSTAQLLAIVMICALTFTNTRGLRYGKVIQNTFTVTKTAALIALIVAGIFVGRNATALAGQFRRPLARTWIRSAYLLRTQCWNRIRTVCCIMREPNWITFFRGLVAQHCFCSRRSTQSGAKCNPGDGDRNRDRDYLVSSG